MRPILFYFFDFPVYSYPLLMGLAWGAAYNISLFHWRSRGLRDRDLNIFVLLTFVLSWLGAKVFFLLFSTPHKVFFYAGELNFWLGGGFVFYGGLLFSLLFALFFFLLNKRLRLRDMGLLIPGLCFGHGVGRIGCFLAGCCYGSEASSFWGVHFHGHDRYPVQIYEALGLFILYGITTRILRRKRVSLVFYIYFLGYSSLRFSMEFMRGDAIRGVYYGLSSSQWVSLSLIIITALFGLMKKGRQEKGG